MKNKTTKRPTIAEKIAKNTCEYCKKCGEITCGNDMKNYSCFERLFSKR